MAKQKSNKKRFKIWLRQFTKYMVAGGAFFWSGYLMFFIGDKYFGWNLWIAKQVANVVGLSVNFVLERYWVFAGERKRSALKVAGWRYVVLTLANFQIDYGIIWGLQQIGITPYLGQFASSGFFTVWNWLWFKYWVFKGHLDEHPAVVRHRKYQKKRKTVKRKQR